MEERGDARTLFAAWVAAQEDGEGPSIDAYCQDHPSSADALLEAVRSLIEGEDKRSPLSDDELAEALRGKGFETKRRTVAKYRTQLGLPSSYRRRRFEG